MKPIVRPCFLVVDREFPGSISTRKLVIETAKYNVLTAYSGREAIETLRLFPNITGSVVDASVGDLPCSELTRELKAIKPEAPVIVICGPGPHDCGGGDQQLESFDPQRLLAMLEALVPAAAAAIEKHNEDLARGER